MASEALATYYNFGRYLLVVPFRVILEKKTACYKCISCILLYKSLALLAQITTIVAVFLVDWVGVFGSGQIRKVVFFCFNAHFVVGCLTLATGGGKFDVLFNTIKDIEFEMTEAGVHVLLHAKKLQRVIKTAGFTLVGFTSIDVMLAYLKVYKGFDQGPQAYFLHARLLFQGHTNCSYFGSGGCDISPVEIGTAVITACGVSYALVVVFYLNFLCFAHAKILLHLANCLALNIKSSSSISLQLAVKLSNQLMRVSYMVEGAVGTIIITFCLALIPYYSFSLQQVLSSESYISRVLFAIDSTAFVYILLVAAEANSKMKRVGNEIAAKASVQFDMALTSNCAPIKTDPGMVPSLMVLQRLNCNEFGLHGKAFTITYELVGSVAGLVVTYTVIMNQFNS